MCKTRTTKILKKFLNVIIAITISITPLTAKLRRLKLGQRLPKKPKPSSSCPGIFVKGVSHSSKCQLTKSRAALVLKRFLSRQLKRQKMRRRRIVANLSFKIGDKVALKNQLGLTINGFQELPVVLPTCITFQRLLRITSGYRIGR